MLFRSYLEGYAGYMTPTERDATLRRFQAGAEATRLIREFLDLVFGP